MSPPPIRIHETQTFVSSLLPVDSANTKLVFVMVSDGCEIPYG